MRTHELDQSTTYICPMHPEVEQDHPGDCPECGMALAPKEQQQDGAPYEGMPQEGHAEPHDHVQMVVDMRKKWLSWRAPGYPTNAVK